MKIKKALAFAALAGSLTTMASSVSSVKADSISNPSQYMKWTQMDTSQPWVKHWGGVPNPGCYVTSIAIQGARAGMEKASNKQTWNPLTILGGSYMGQQSVRGYGSGGKSYNFHMKESTSHFSPDIMSAKAMGEENARKAIKAYQAKGEFSIIHMDSGSGYDPSFQTHYISVNEVKGNTLKLYDPARSSSYSTTKHEQARGHKNLLQVTAWVEGWGGGPKSFNGGPDADGDSSSSSKGSKDSSSSKSNDVPKIKPIFNPFRTPTVKDTTLGANVNQKNSAFDLLTLQNLQNIGPKLISWLQIAAIVFMWVFLGYTLITSMLAIGDYWFNGLISEGLRHLSFGQDFFFPNGDGLFGYTTGGWTTVKEIKRVAILMCTIVFICGLILTDTLPYILGDVFYLLQKMFNSLT